MSDRIFPMVVLGHKDEIMFYVNGETGGYLIPQTPIPRGMLKNLVRRGQEILDRTENFA